MHSRTVAISVAVTEPRNSRSKFLKSGCRAYFSWWLLGCILELLLLLARENLSFGHMSCCLLVYVLVLPSKLNDFALNHTEMNMLGTPNDGC
jgi:hypothetical protein